MLRINDVRLRRNDVTAYAVNGFALTGDQPVENRLPHDPTRQPFFDRLYLSIIDYIRQMDMKRDRDSIAIKYFGNKVSRKEYWETIRKYRKCFGGIGIKKGDPVTICMMNSPEYEYIFSSILENGSIASTVSKSFINADFKRQTLERGSRVLILSVEFAEDLAKAKAFSQLGNNDEELHLEKVFFTTAGSYMPSDQEKHYCKLFNIVIHYY